MKIMRLFGFYFLKLFLKIVFENIKNIIFMFFGFSVFLVFENKNTMQIKQVLNIFIIFFVSKNKKK